MGIQIEPLQVIGSLDSSLMTVMLVILCTTSVFFSLPCFRLPCSVRRVVRALTLKIRNLCSDAHS